MDEQRAWIKSRRKKRLRILAAALACCLLFTTYPDILETLSVLATGTQNGGGTVYVTAFESLPKEVREQTVPVGTGAERLTLPDTLEAVVAIPEGEALPEDAEEETQTPPESAEEETEAPPEGTEEETKTSEAEGTETEDAEPTQETHTVTMPEYQAGNVISAETLENTQETGTKEETVTIEDITWQSETAYDGNTEGTYIFTAVLPEGYALMESVSLPQITVTVQADSADSVIQALLERIAALPDAEEYLAGEPETEAGEEAYEKWMEGLYAYAEEALAIWEEYNALTEEQRAQIPEEALTKLAAWAELAETAGKGVQVMAGTTTTPPEETATEGDCGETCTWKFADGTLTITPKSETGFIKGANAEDIPWAHLRDSIKSVVIEDGVTGIGYNAFCHCSNLTSVSIPNSVKNIYECVFTDCTSLESVTIPDSVETIGHAAFSACTGLKSITIPKNVKSIELQMFQGCKSLTSVEIRGSVTSIGDRAFQGCKSLKNTGITIPNTVKSIGDNAFTDCDNLTTVTIPESVTSIGEYAFSDCNNLESVDIQDSNGSETTIGNWAFTNCPKLKRATLNGVKTISDRAFNGCIGLTTVSMDSATSIGASAFDGCTNLTGITIPDGVTSIGGFAFSGCKGLTELTMPEGVKTIGSSAFSSCTGLTTVIMPASVDSIGASAFSGCTGLTSVTIEGAASIGTSAFYGCTGLTTVSMDKVTSIGGGAFHSCTSLTGITIPEGVPEIKGTTFYMCKSLTSISIPDSVTSIGDYAFNCCNGLTSVTISKKVESIGASAFASCTGLTNIVIPSSVTSIEPYAFQGCSELKTVAFESTTPPTLKPSLNSNEAKVFADCPYLNDADPATGITVPEGCASDYETQWNETFPEFANNIATHTHKPCGAIGSTACGHKDNACNALFTFDQKITNDTTALTAGNNYYLAEDVTLNSRIVLNASYAGGTVNICLNGHTLTGNNCGVFEIIGKSADTTTVNICDCSEGKSGTIKVDKTDDTKTPNVIDVTSATLNVYGGTIKCVGGGIYGVALHTNGALNMYGGKISTRAYSVCVYENSSDTNINIYDGDINSSNTNTICTKSPSTIDISGGTIHSESYVAINTVDTNMTISGESKITNNSTGDFAIEYRKSTVGNPTLTISGNTTIKGRGCINIGGGTVNISGGTIESTGNGSDTIRNNAAGTLNITGGKVISKGVAINNDGTVIIENTSSEGITSSGSYTLYNDTGAKLTVSGGTITNTKEGSDIENYGTAIYNLSTNASISGNAVVISNGKFGKAIENAGTLDISGGTLKSIGNNSNTIYNKKGGTLTITGGKLIGSYVTLHNYGNTIIKNTAVEGITSTGRWTIYNYADATAEISGGKIENTCDQDDSIAIQNQGNLTINGNAAVTSTNGMAIYNLHTIESISGNAQVTCTNGKAIVNGAVDVDNSSDSLTITGGNISSSGSCTLQNNTGAAFTISGGTIENTKKGGVAIENLSTAAANSISGNAQVICTASSGRAIVNGDGSSNASVTINNGTITAHTHALENYSGATAIISGGDFKNEASNPCISNSGKMEIESGSSITSSTWPVSNSKELTISGGKFDSSSGGYITNNGTLFKLSGSPEFINTGIRLDSESAMITIAGELSYTRPCKVSFSGNTDSTSRTFTTGWNTYMSSAEPSDYFKSRYTYCTAAAEGTGKELILRPSKVTFYLNYTGCGSGDSVFVDTNSMATFPEDPTYEGFVFNGWYDSTGKTQYTSESTFTNGDIVLRALWKPECNKHTLDSENITKTATQHTGVCTECGKEVTENHTYADDWSSAAKGTKWDSDETGHWQLCTLCKEKGTVANHDEVADNAVPPTCTEKGKEEGSHCRRCNFITKEQAEIPATGHDYTYTANGSTITERCDEGCNHSATATLSLDSSVSLTYNGSAIEPVTVTYNAGWVGDNPATIEYTNNINVADNPATASLTISGATASLNFDITAKPLDESMITLASGPHYYTGSAIMPDVTVTDAAVGDSGALLVKGTDYTVRYEDNTEVSTDSSTAQVIITGQGNYTGERIVNFTIEAKPATKVTVTITATNCTPDGITKDENGLYKAETDDSNNYSVTFTPDSGYNIPETVTVAIGGTTLDPDKYTYTKADGKLTIPKKEITGNITIIAEAKQQIQKPVIGGEGQGKEGNTVSEPGAPDADGKVTFTGTYGKEYTPVIHAGGKDYTPEMTWNENSGKGEWTCKIPEADCKGGITAEFKYRGYTKVTIQPTEVSIYADDDANKDAGTLTDYLKENCVVKTEYDNGTSVVVTAGADYTPDKGFDPKGATYKYKVDADGETGEITLTVKPVTAAVKAPDALMKKKKEGGYTEDEVKGWLPKTVAVTYTGDGYTAKLENSTVTWETDSIAGTAFGASDGTKTIKGTVDLPGWATGTADVSIKIKFGSKAVLTDEQMTLSVSGWAYGAQTAPDPKGSVAVADTDAVYKYHYSADNGTSWVVADQLPKSTSGNIIPGTYLVEMNYTGRNYAGVKRASFDVVEKPLTVGKGTLAVEDRNYDGTTNATLKKGGELALSGIVANDDVALGGTLSAVFTNKGPKKDISVTVTGFELTGKDAQYYRLVNETVTLKATINNADGSASSGGSGNSGNTDSSGDDDSDEDDDSNEDSDSSGNSGNGNSGNTSGGKVSNTGGSGTGKGGVTGTNGGKVSNTGGSGTGKGGTVGTSGGKGSNTGGSGTDKGSNTGKGGAVGTGNGNSGSQKPEGTAGQPGQGTNVAGPDGAAQAESTQRTEDGNVQTIKALADDGRIVIADEKAEPTVTGSLTGDSPETTRLLVGEGEVIVTVVCADGKYTAGTNDASAMANAVLTPEQIQLVNSGETVEVRVDVKDISDSIPKQDMETMEKCYEAYEKDLPELTWGAFVDISVYMKTGDSGWNAVAETKEPLEIVIGIPETLRGDGREYYVIRAHGDKYSMLNDMDDVPDTITIISDMFSSYAIVYRQTGGGAWNGTARCGLCHICPTFLGICCFVWIAGAAAVVSIAVTIVMIVRHRKKG